MAHMVVAGMVDPVVGNRQKLVNLLLTSQLSTCWLPG